MAIYPLVENAGSAQLFFQFEEDFVEDNVRCIPMIVRFKLDACGIKLKLPEWSRFRLEEREQLSFLPCSNSLEIARYRQYIEFLVIRYTGRPATDLAIDAHPAWANKSRLPVVLEEKLREFDWAMSVDQWRSISNLQRFVLLKLCRPGHENRNFPKAMIEFNLV